MHSHVEEMVRVCQVPDSPIQGQLVELTDQVPHLGAFFEFFSV